MSRTLSVFLILNFVLVATAAAQNKVVVVPLHGDTGPAGAPGYILGVSSQSSNARFQFGGEFGLRAADAMCKASYTEEPTAHLCSHAEVQNSLSTGQYSATPNFDDVVTWSVSNSSESGSSFSGSSANSCHYLGYNSGDTAVGTRLTVELDYLVPGNGGGVTVDHYEIRSNISCGSNYPVLCCR